MNWVIYNSSESNLILVLEPSAVAYEINPGSKVLAEGTFIETAGCSGEIEIDSNNVITLYLEPGAAVTENQKPAKHAPGW